MTSAFQDFVKANSLWWKDVAGQALDEENAWPDMLALFPEWYQEWVVQYPIEKTGDRYRFGFDDNNRRLEGLNWTITRLVDDFFYREREDLAIAAREKLFFEFYR